MCVRARVRARACVRFAKTILMRAVLNLPFSSVPVLPEYRFSSLFFPSSAAGSGWPALTVVMDYLIHSFVIEELPDFLLEE